MPDGELKFWRFAAREDAGIDDWDGE